MAHHNNRSEAWKYFKRIDEHKSECKFCLKTLGCKGSSTSGLLTHLKSIHRIDFKKEPNDSFQDNAEEQLGNQSCVVEVPMEDPFRSTQTAPMAYETSNSSEPFTKAQKRMHEPTPTLDSVLYTIDDFLKKQRTDDDQHDIFGKNVAFKLRNLDSSQRLMAERIINDALFYAEANLLTMSHSVKS